MAKIPTSVSEKIFNISVWRGVNESPEGEAALKTGEASRMRNFQVTSGGALRKRPGSRNVAGLLAAYLPHVREGSERLRMTDLGPGRSYEMYPRMTADEVGVVHPAGSPVTVSPENAGEYAGYYFNKDGGLYALTKCVVTPGEGTEDISGGRARAGELTVIASGSESAGAVTGTVKLETFREAYVDASGVGVRGERSEMYAPSGETLGWNTQDVGGYCLYNGRLYRYYGARVDSNTLSHRWKKYACVRSSVGFTFYTQDEWKLYGTQKLIPGENPAGYPGYKFNSKDGTYTTLGQWGWIGEDKPGTVYNSYGYCQRDTVSGNTWTIHRRYAHGPYTGYDDSYTKGAYMGDIQVRDGAMPEADAGYEYVTTFREDGVEYTVMSAGQDYFCYAKDTDASAAALERTWSFHGYPLTVSPNRADWYGSETYAQVSEPTDTAVRGIWSGFVGGREVLCAACGGFLWELRLEDGVWSKVPAGEMDTGRDVHMFGFDEKLYILNGLSYMVWDGERLRDVEGYRPLVSVSAEPGGGGTLLESVNRLTAGRRCWFSPDGSATVFQLPEKDIASVDWVRDLTQPEAALDDAQEVTEERAAEGGGPYDISVDAGNTAVRAAAHSRPSAQEVTEERAAQVCGPYGDLAVQSNADAISEPPVGAGHLAGPSTDEQDASVMAAIPSYTFDLAAGTVTFASPPAKGINTLEIAWSAGEDLRHEVRAMRFAEVYNGAQDTRVFLYGDGSNRALYSGLDHNGQPRADYFPDLYEVAVGDANTPITAMIRHYNKLMAFKLDSAWSIGYDAITLADGTVTAGFYVAPVNRSIGNCAYGQAQLVLNRPRTLDGRSVIEWQATSSSGGITGDQRNAQRVSQRVDSSIRGFDLTKAKTFYDKISHEYFVIGQDGTAIAQNLDVDAWYVYTGLMATCMINYRDELYYGTADGFLRHFSTEYLSDNGQAIDAYWESGAMSFSEDFRRKYSAMVWIGIKPEDNGYLEVTARTDRSRDFAVYSVKTQDAGAVPETERIKLKAKKFTYYKLILQNNTADRTVTVVSADMRVRGTGFVK